MSLIDEMKPIFTKKGLIFPSTGVLGGLMWILHFVIEIRALKVVNLEPIYILFHLAALPLGSLFYLLYTATTIIFQTEEPLPSKVELEWRKSVEHILVLSRAGIPLYSQSLQDQEPVADAILAGGAIIGISSIVNEITKMKDIKVIKQENYCKMLEAGSHVILTVLTSKDLKIIRQKMIDFVSEFESFFSDVLKVCKGDDDVFFPTKRLV